MSRRWWPVPRGLACALAALVALAGAPAGASVTAAAGARGGTGCLVPELSGLRVRVAKAELEWANCRLGHVTTRHVAAWKRGYVLSQSVPADSVRRAGFRVGITVGR
jgi:beta-lactam-binding protein with PASTA domain